MGKNLPHSHTLKGPKYPSEEKKSYRSHPGGYLKPNGTSAIEFFHENNLRLLVVDYFPKKSSVVDVSLGSKYATATMEDICDFNRTAFLKLNFIILHVNMNDITNMAKSFKNLKVIHDRIKVKVPKCCFVISSVIVRECKTGIFKMGISRVIKGSNCSICQ